MQEPGEGPRKFGSVAEFAREVSDELADHLAPAKVSFRGSFAEGTNDEYSDVDILARVASELDSRFFSDVEELQTGLYGPALIRYDPDYRGNVDSQHVRFSFYELPVFWRVDLEIASDQATAEKGPSPFPRWEVGTSALMNVVWAVKYHRRGLREAGYGAPALHRPERVGGPEVSLEPRRRRRGLVGEDS